MICSSPEKKSPVEGIHLRDEIQIQTEKCEEKKEHGEEGVSEVGGSESSLAPTLSVSPPYLHPEYFLSTGDMSTQGAREISQARRLQQRPLPHTDNSYRAVHRHPTHHPDPTNDLLLSSHAHTRLRCARVLSSHPPDHHLQTP